MLLTSSSYELLRVIVLLLLAALPSARVSKESILSVETTQMKYYFVDRSSNRARNVACHSLASSGVKNKSVHA